jgi:hypothetical protein
VDLAAATARSASNAVAAERRAVAEQPPPGRSGIPSSPATGPTTGSPRPARPAPPAVDLDRIVDAVHRRVVRRLAIEAERRGGR